MSEVNALKTLRETTLAHLSQSDYERILKAVEVGGIESLTGTASMIVKSAVLKHGAHDQSSHNPKKGGGGGGGGGGGSSSERRPRENPFTGEPSDNPNSVNPFTGKTNAQDISDAKEDIANRIKGAESQVGRLKPSSMSPQDSQTDSRIEGTVKGYKAAGALIGKPDKLGKLKADMVRAKENVLSPSYGIVGTDRAYVYGFADAVISVADAYGTLKND